MRVLVVGGGGFFGRRIVEALSRDSGFETIAAGRHPPGEPLPCAFEVLDTTSPPLSQRVRDIAPQLIIHCAGPFRPGAYPLVENALACGSHYLDLADNGSYVRGIERFDPQARRAGLVVLSGLSSVPALSSAVVAEGRPAFSRLLAIDIGITSAERIPGRAAVQGVLEQAGLTLPAAPGQPAGALAWADRFSVLMPAPVGPRIFSRCDVPDLTLLPLHIPGLDRVSFRAGVPWPALMWGLRVFARLRQRGWIRRPVAWTGLMAAGARLFQPFGDGASGMFVRLFGNGHDGLPQVLCWWLIARALQGVLVPTRGVLAVARRLRDGAVPYGARASVAELSVADYLGEGLPLTIRVDRLQGEAARRDEACWSRA